MTSDDIERIARAVLARLGDASPETVRAVVGEVAREGGAERVVRLPVHTTPRGAEMPEPPPEGESPPVDYCATCVEQERTRARARAILTTTGRNRRGIVARLTRDIADAGGDILDISQTLVSDYFTMIIIVDLARLDVPFADFKERVLAACRDLELQATIIHEDVLRAFQRV